MLVRSMSFINQLVRRASPVYVLEVEPLQHFSCNMLDVTIYQNNDKIEFKPYIKPTSQKRPLSSASWHAPSVHMSWPLAELQRLARRASTHNHFIYAKKRFILYLKKFMINGNIIKKVEEHDPYSYKKQKYKPQSSNPIRCIVAYHPCIHKVLNRSIHEIKERWKSQMEPMFLDLCISYKNYGKSIATHCRRIFEI